MLSKTNRKCWKTLNSFNARLAMILLFGLAGYAQTTDTQTATIVSQPVLTEYKAIKIGTAADEVRDRLGKAEIDDKDGFYYRFSDDEFAQIRLDENNKVRLLAVTYASGRAPKFTDVFGADATPESQPDGSIYKLVRYPEAGYWVAYSRTAGDKPRVTVTMQKMRAVK